MRSWVISNGISVHLFDSFDSRVTFDWDVRLSCQDKGDAGPADIFTHILVFTSIFYTVKQSIGCFEQYNICVYMSEKEKKKERVIALYLPFPRAHIEHKDINPSCHPGMTRKDQYHSLDGQDLRQREKNHEESAKQSSPN
ncbi:Disease resistance protein TIR-NBS-LRR class family [Prunus dulcis]|uniref:Disease resistance protein TIR-NBS-LRR class family n=1 Tax=Prunus dulcis TaxID=3755 RepID=A0A4Y1QVW1_PRUDU|nr:Disease resistance protein TIR-NBS-LRR class family [Prunus dulcis]